MSIVAFTAMKPEVATAFRLHDRNLGSGPVEGFSAGVAQTGMGLALDQGRGISDFRRRDGDGVPKCCRTTSAHIL